MTAQLTHETRLTSIALSTTSFPIIWCAGHMPAQNNDCHMFYQKLLLCINDGPVIVTGMNSVGTQHVTYLTHFPIPYLYAKKKKKNSSKWTESKDDRWIYDSELSCHWVKYIYLSQSLKCFEQASAQHRE